MKYSLLLFNTIIRSSLNILLTKKSPKTTPCQSEIKRENINGITWMQKGVILNRYDNIINRF